MSTPAPQKNFCISLKSSTSKFGRHRADDGNPLSSLQFEPAWDSDELYDALRIAYPQIRSHKDRFLRAVIEFYDAELGKARKSGVGLSTPPTSLPDMASNEVSLDNREGSSSSENLELPSWRPHENHGASANKRLSQKRKQSGIEGMQATFSIVPGGGKQRTKRLMTDAEREQYRHTKKVGACEPCRKRKRKCICKLATQAHSSDAKRPRLASNCLPIKDHTSVTNEPTAVTDDKYNKFDHDTHLLALDALDPEDDKEIEEGPENLALSCVSRSLSLSPISTAFDAEFDLSSFLLCPELTLGDLAMPGNPVTSLGLQDGPLSSQPASGPVFLASSEKPVKFPYGYSDCEAFINFQESATDTDSTIQHGVSSLYNASPPGSPKADFTHTLQLISRAATLLAPLSRFGPDAQLLLNDLNNLKVQLKFLLEPLPLSATSTNYFNTARGRSLDIKEPLQEFLMRLEKSCNVDDLVGQRSGLAYTSTTFQIRKPNWAQGVKDDARKLRGLIGRKL
ncbi:hypothetical protein E6O75_ATG10380 [Venturia nashicola]|uniref:Uncharacterized protein n=1 Tax=Venturia nashicola TaxID=86259 RepID=A0A4Z1P8R2_9PEZI|nr:hypothetical protein E6O75_ATG10380 [Venturia nashicola]